MFIFTKLTCMIKAEYKNALQTKMKISSTYLALSIEKKGKFSVTDVVERAKINRGTFYLHFKNLKEVEKYIDDAFTLWKLILGKLI